MAVVYRIGCSVGDYKSKSGGFKSREEALKWGKLQWPRAEVLYSVRQTDDGFDGLTEHRVAKR